MFEYLCWFSIQENILKTFDTVQLLFELLEQEGLFHWTIFLMGKKNSLAFFKRKYLTPTICCKQVNPFVQASKLVRLQPDLLVCKPLL